VSPDEAAHLAKAIWANWTSPSFLALAPLVSNIRSRRAKIVSVMRPGKDVPPIMSVVNDALSFSLAARPFPQSGCDVLP
jgi:hypothetical protein